MYTWINDPSFLEECVHVDLINLWKQLQNVVTRGIHLERDNERAITIIPQEGFALALQLYHKKIVVSALLMNVFVGRGTFHARIWENIVYHNVPNSIFYCT